MIHLKKFNESSEQEIILTMNDVGDKGFTKLKTRMYPKSGWGLYFKI